MGVQEEHSEASATAVRPADANRQPVIPGLFEYGFVVHIVADEEQGVAITDAQQGKRC